MVSLGPRRTTRRTKTPSRAGVDQNGDVQPVEEAVAARPRPAGGRIAGFAGHASVKRHRPRSLDWQRGAAAGS